MRRQLDTALQLLAPIVLVVAVGIGSRFVSSAHEIYFLNALVSVAIVVAVYVFIGNSGVLSFGQISFVAVGAFASGVLTIPLESKTGVLLVQGLQAVEATGTLRPVSLALLASMVKGAVVEAAMSITRSKQPKKTRREAGELLGVLLQGLRIS